ncbi:ferredoxin-NADP reductase/hemoglobin-like flavoprotein [Streptomyces sp. V3I8]|uniref:globin domain-containing protein n=1 Tax=Streptomyces sp. V3I8 TaxID=3042279 RepID=UPI002780CD98|nr:globin domain-containing protein [Streptomyces sp. V3I8]MDQ1036732.1 ferredoxin-NADP reductase/hemoglobin-like flavoprotein [Streptomyces sp. V3I8]
MDPEILRTSFAVVERRAEFALKYFYSHLFWHHPDVRALFPLDSPGDKERQRDRLFTALALVIARLEGPGLDEYLRDLGREHRKYLAKPEHYTAVGTSLIAAFAAVSGSAWTDEVEKAWDEAYRVIANAMLGAAGEAESQGEPSWWDAEVVGRTAHGGDLAVLTLRPHRALPHLPGQYVSVGSPRLPGVWRPYSVGNAPRCDHTLDLHVSLVEDGALSPELVRRARPGDVLRIAAASGRLTLRTPVERPPTFIAAGTGWAPVKALLEHLAGEPGPYDEARLFVVARDTAYLYDRAALAKLRTRLPWLDVTVITPAPGRPKLQATERLLTALGNRANWARHDVYLAGPPGLVQEISAALPGLGADPARVFRDELPAAGQEPASSLGPGEWLLQRPRPRWHGPSGRDGGCGAGAGN